MSLSVSCFASINFLRKRKRMRTLAGCPVSGYSERYTLLSQSCRDPHPQSILSWFINKWKVYSHHRKVTRHHR